MLEDNVPQQIRKVDMAQAPLTVALVVEFSNRYQQLYSWTWYITQQMVWTFASSLKPDDYCAVIAYDMKPEILTDFTTDKMKIQEALQQLTIPAWHEANMFDAVTDTADRMSAIEGRKAILLITTGVDTFSKITYDQTRKKLQEAGVPIYADFADGHAAGNDDDRRRSVCCKRTTSSIHSPRKPAEERFSPSLRPSIGACLTTSARLSATSM